MGGLASTVRTEVLQELGQSRVTCVLLSYLSSLVAQGMKLVAWAVFPMSPSTGIVTLLRCPWCPQPQHCAPPGGHCPRPIPRRTLGSGAKEGFIWGHICTKTPEDAGRGCVSLEGVTCRCSGCPCTPAEPAAGHRSQPVQLRAPWNGSLGRSVQEKRVNKGLDWGIPQISRGSGGASPLPGRLPAVLHTGSLWLAAGRGTWGEVGVTSDLLVPLLWDEEGWGSPKGAATHHRGAIAERGAQGSPCTGHSPVPAQGGWLKGAGRDSKHPAQPQRYLQATGSGCSWPLLPGLPPRRQLQELSAAGRNGGGGS